MGQSDVSRPKSDYATRISRSTAPKTVRSGPVKAMNLTVQHSKFH